MDDRFNMEVLITSYEVGPYRTLRPSSLLCIMQEAAGKHLEQDGQTYECMRKEGIVFLLVDEAVTVLKMPKCNDVITVTTWFERCEGVKFIRNMIFYDKDGREIIKGVTRWIIADPQTHKILRPCALPFTMPQARGSEDMPRSRRIRLPDDAVRAGGRTVRWSDIDCNRHMNNSVYADVVCDFYPGGLEGMEITDMQISFEGEASLGDDIEIYTSSAEDGVIYKGTVDGKRCFSAYAKAEKRRD